MAQTIKLKRSATQNSIPTTSALALGEVAINTYDGKMYIKKSVGGTETVVEVGGGGGISSSFTVYEYAATANQTTFSGSDGNSNTLAYDTDTPPKILVYLNGVLLDFTTDYTASNGTSVVLTNAAAANDLVQIAAYKSSVSTSLDISLSDSQKLLLGNSNDLQIYHDGSNSFINETGTGSLYIGAESEVQLRSYSTNEKFLVGTSNGATSLYYNGARKLDTTNTGINVIGSATITDTSSTATALTIGSSSATSYTKQDWITSEHNAGTAYLIAYGASHSSEAGNFAIKNLAANKEIFFELSSNVEPLRLTSTGATVTGNITVSGTVDGVDIQTLNTTAGAALPKAGGTMTGDLTLSGTDPIITFQDTSANTDPSGRIVFSEVSGTNNFDINYNGTDDRLEFRGSVSNVQQDLVYINRSASTPLSVLGSISVTGTVDGRDLATDGSKLDNIESNADVTDTVNVTAAGALMDSEVTNLAQVKAFDSSDYATATQGSTADSALQNLVEDTTPQLGGDLDLNSNNITGTGSINITGSGTLSGQLRALGSGDAAFTSTTHAFQTGATSGLNIIIDDNEIMARNNGASTNLLLQADGGNVTFRQNGLGTTNLVMGTTTFLDHSLNLSNIGTISSGAITSSAAITGTSLQAINTLGYGQIEVGGANGAYIDLKKPATDDYDVRLVTDAGTGGRIQSNGVFDIDAVGNMVFDADGGTIALRDNGSSMASFTTSAATFAGTISSGNITTTGYLAGPATFTIDPAAVGDNTGTVVIAGNLQVDGTTTTINSTTLAVDDKNITLASGSANAAAASGAGFTVDIGTGTNPTITYDGTNDEWDFNKPLNVTGSVSTGGNLKVYTAGYPQARLGISDSNYFDFTFDNPTDTLKIGKNGSAKVTVGANGNVGIGTTSPGYALDLIGATNYRSLLIGQSEATGTKRQAIAARHYTSSEQPHNMIGMFTDSNTNSILSIGGGLGATGDFNSVTEIQLHTGNGTTVNTTAAMIIDATGNVGIGTTAPAEELEISADAPSLQLESTNASGRSYGFQSMNTGKLGIYDADAGLNRIVLDSSGNVGIGTSSPGAKLDILQTAETFNDGIKLVGSSGPISGRIYMNGEHLHIDNATAGANSGLTLDDNGNIGIGTDSPSYTLTLKDNSANTYIRFENTTTNLGWIGYHGDGDLSFWTNASARSMNITSSGNMGIGIEDPAFRFHTYHPTTNVVGRFESGDAQVWIDLHDSNSGNYGALLGHDGAAGHLFKVADASVNTRFLVKNDGIVGIGTSNPQAQLQVNELGIDTTTTSTSATTQVAIDTFTAATFRSARYTIQVTNSTDSTYHITEVLLIHDGTTPQITEYGTIFTGSAEATFDADITSGNVRLLATPATTDSMTFKVVRHCITV